MILPLGLCPDITIGPPKEPLCKTCFCSLTLFPGYYSELTHRQHLYFDALNVEKSIVLRN